MCEDEMVSVEELKNTLHNEEMKVIVKKVAKQTEKNREKRIAREKMLSGPTEYIDLLRKAKVPITQTDIKQAVNPAKSKILEGLDFQERLVMAHYIGIVDGLKLRLGVIVLLVLLYVVPLEWL